jgi:phage terminase small subunit
MRLFQEQIEQIEPLCVEELIIEDIVVPKVDPEISKYIQERLNLHNNRFLLKINDKKVYENTIIKLLNLKKTKKPIDITRKELKAIKLLVQGDIFLEEKYMKDVQSLI